MGDGQTEAEGVPSQGGRGDALLRRMPPYLTSPDAFSLSAVVYITREYSVGFEVVTVSEVNAAAAGSFKRKSSGDFR